MGRPLAVTIGLMASVLVGACSTGIADPGPEQIMGAYTLTSISGVPMPTRTLLTVYYNGAVVSDSSIASSGSLIMNAGSGFNVSLVQRDKIFSGTQVIQDQTETDPIDGVWTLNGASALTLSYTKNGQAQTVPALLALPTITVTVVDTIQTSATQSTPRTRLYTFTKQ